VAANKVPSLVFSFSKCKDHQRDTLCAALVIIRMISEYIAKVSSGELEWTRVVLFWIFIAANCGVVLGVFLEKEEHSHVTKLLGWRMLVISLSLEIFFATVSFSMESEINRRQKLDIDDLHGTSTSLLDSAKQAAEEIRRLTNPSEVDPGNRTKR
jgi:hypothetical protein